MITFGGRTGEATTELGSLLAALSPNPEQAQSLLENSAHMESRTKTAQMAAQLGIFISLPSYPAQVMWWVVDNAIIMGGLFRAKLWLLYVSCPHGNPSTACLHDSSPPEHPVPWGLVNSCPPCWCSALSTAQHSTNCPPCVITVA